jgi:hypothetical protein
MALQEQVDRQELQVLLVLVELQGMEQVEQADRQELQVLLVLVEQADRQELQEMELAVLADQLVRAE